MMTIRLVVFDMAGTTVHDDGAVNHCLREVLANDGVFVDRASVDEVMGEPKPVAIAKLLSAATNGQAWRPDDDHVQALHRRFEALMVEHYESAGDVRPADGAEATFETLKRDGRLIALDTGFNRLIVDAILRRLGWDRGGLLDATVASDEVDRGRPYPDLIDRAMRLTGVTSSLQVAKVGDTPVDLLEGTAAGCARVIGITTGAHSRESLLRHPHTDLVDHLREIPPLLV